MRVQDALEERINARFGRVASAVLGEKLVSTDRRSDIIG
jgi:hypothetical protein